MPGDGLHGALLPGVQRGAGAGRAQREGLTVRRAEVRPNQTLLFVAGRHPERGGGQALPEPLQERPGPGRYIKTAGRIRAREDAHQEVGRLPVREEEEEVRARGRPERDDRRVRNAHPLHRTRIPRELHLHREPEVRQVPAR